MLKCKGPVHTELLAIAIVSRMRKKWVEHPFLAMSANAKVIAKSSVWSELNAQTQTKPAIVCAIIYKISFRLQVKTMIMASIRGSNTSSWCRSLGVLSLWLCLLFYSSHVTLAQENGEETSTETLYTGPTTPEVFHIDFEHRESTTSSITIGWKVPNGYEVSEYEVISRKSSGNATTFSGPIGPWR